MFGLILSLILYLISIKFALYIYGFYFTIALVLAFKSTFDLIVAILTIPVILIQFSSYGCGFLKAKIKLTCNRKPEMELFPNLFFKTS